LPTEKTLSYGLWEGGWEGKLKVLLFCELSWFFSALRGECHDVPLKYAAAASFPILSNSSFNCNYSNRRYVAWDTDSFIK
jgi:hypothetical protein